MTNFERRIRSLQDEIKEKGLGSFLVTNEANVKYLSAFTGEDSILLITEEKRFFITDSRYIEEAKESLKGQFNIIETNLSIFETVKKIAGRNRVKKIGFEAMNMP